MERILPDALKASARKYGLRAIKAARLARRERWREAMKKGVGATVEHERLPLKRDYGTVIDVGANRGQFALYVRERFPDANVFSVEPLSGPRSSIIGLFAGDDRVTVLPFAAGAAEGTAEINVTQQDDSSSLLAPTSLQTTRFAGTNTRTTEMVTVRRLDDMIDVETLADPVLLKLDVQGFELEALKGAEGLLQRVDTVMCECSFVEFYAGQALFDDIYGFLLERGFRLVGGAPSAVTGGAWEQGDFVFSRVGEVKLAAQGSSRRP